MIPGHLELSARRTTPYEEVGDLNSEQGTKIMLAEQSGLGCRGLQKPSLEQEVSLVLVGISVAMDLVV